MRSISSVGAAASTSYVAIDAGGSAAGAYIADADFSGGTISGSGSAVDTSRVSNPAPQSVYQKVRYGSNFSYIVPNLTPNRSYNVRLQFVESYFTAAAKRVFSVSINGAKVITNLDIFQAVGANVAMAKTFPATADASGKITVSFLSTVNNALIAAIEITDTSSTASAAPVAPGVAINVGGAVAGSWIADAGYTGGWTAKNSGTIDTSRVSNPPSQTVYQTQRTGTSFSYSVSNETPNGAYTVRLHFVESWFTQTGMRLFNVSLNGVQVLSGFDTYKAAGGKNVAVVEPFAAKADATGKIALQFVATKDNASIAGIEIVGGSTTGTQPTPTAVPSISPTAPPPVSGNTWPAAGWVPYPSGPLVVPVPPNPTYTSGSAGIVNALWGGQPTFAGTIHAEAGKLPPSSSDFSQPLYFGRAGDPSYTVSCYEFGGGCHAKGATVHIPRGAYPAGGSDHHIAIRDLVTGQDVMLWLAPVPNGNGGTYSVGWGTTVSSTGNGLNAVGGSASGLSALWALRATDLAHDTINHAIVVGVNGESADGYVYPAMGWDNGYFHSNPWPKMGAHFWLDVAPPYASNCPKTSVSYLHALNKYGAYMADNANVPVFEASFESDMDYTYNGGASVWGPLMQPMGGRLVGDNNVQISTCGINMKDHMHVLNPPPAS